MRHLGTSFCFFAERRLQLSGITLKAFKYLVALYRAIRLRFGYGFALQPGSNRAMRTDRETSKTQTFDGAGTTPIPIK